MKIIQSAAAFLVYIVSSFIFLGYLFIWYPDGDTSLQALADWLLVPLLCIGFHWLLIRWLKTEKSGFFKYWNRLDIFVGVFLCLLCNDFFTEIFTKERNWAILSAIMTLTVALFVAERILCLKKPEDARDQEAEP